MKNTQLLLINDMCGYGKVALSAMLPVLSHMGYRIHNLPTALVSDTLNYPKFYIHDTTEYVRQSLAIWEELGFEFDAISTGFIVTEEEARNYKLNPFDLTKVWYHKDFPLHEVGVLELNRNPENYYADVEQAAFNPMNIVEGIGFSPDKMLQGRLFSYGDAQRYRLGVNHTEIPVNRPRCPIHAFHRDGQMRTDGNYGSAKGYEPNSYGEWQDTPALKEPPLAVNGDVYNYDERELDSDYFTQPGLLWRVMSAEDQKATCENTARAMGDAELFIKQRHTRHCYYADPAYGKGVAEALGISLEEALRAEDPAHPSWDPRK